MHLTVECSASRFQLGLASQASGLAYPSKPAFAVFIGLNDGRVDDESSSSFVVCRRRHGTVLVGGTVQWRDV